MKEFTEQMIADRRFLHAHPEEGWCEFETTWYIVNRLQELGLEWKAGIDVIEPTAVMGRNAELVEKAQKRALEHGVPADFLESLGGYTGAMAILNTGRPGPVTQATLRIVKVFWSLDSALAQQRHFPAINWLTSYSLYQDTLGPWLNQQQPGWMELRQRMMSLLQEESELEEIVKLVGQDALSAPDRLKMEAARSIREDFLHQNSFHEIDTYTPLHKQLRMMQLTVAYFDDSLAALNQGADINGLIRLPVREAIGRYKYTPNDQIDSAYEKIREEMAAQISELLQTKEEF